MLLTRTDGYGIDYDAKNLDDAKTVIIAMHGFCGDKESSCITALETAITTDDIGLIKFDWPGHGKSETTGDHLTIENCMEDLSAIIDFVKMKAPQTKLVAFATSFGGYLTLIYNAKHPRAFDKIILRSPAIRMYDVLTTRILSPTALTEVNQTGFTTYGFERDLKITKKLLNDLKKSDIMQIYSHGDAPSCDQLYIIHGTDDDLVNFADSENFVQTYGGKLYPVIGADHRYKKPGEIEKIIAITKTILNS